MTDTQVRDEVMNLLIAGHETTALVLSWADGEAETPTLDGLIDEQLMYREASRLPQAALTAARETRAAASARAEAQQA